MDKSRLIKITPKMQNRGNKIVKIIIEKTINTTNKHLIIECNNKDIIE
jgi:hypothetical protein